MAFNPIKGHPIHDSLKRLLALQKNTILSPFNGELSEQHSWYLDRIFYLARRANDQIKRRISMGVSLNAINNLNTSADSIASELNNYIANRNPGHIDGAFNQAEQGFLIYLQQAFQPKADIDGSEADITLANLKDASQAAILDVQQEKSKLLAEISTLSSSVAENIQHLAELGNGIDASKDQISQQIESINLSYSELTGKFEERFSKMDEEWDQSKVEKISQIDQAVEELLKRIFEKETEARSLVQSVGEVLITGTYQKTASDESKLANSFRWITIALFTTGILIVLSNYISHIIANLQGISYDENPWTIVARFLTALVVSLPAFYTARESARHRTNADNARQRELELSTLGPFIELLPAEIKAQIRDRLTDRYFGNPVDAHTYEPPVTADNLAKIADSVAKLVKIGS